MFWRLWHKNVQPFNPPYTVTNVKIARQLTLLYRTYVAFWYFLMFSNYISVIFQSTLFENCTVYASHKLKRERDPIRSDVTSSSAVENCISVVVIYKSWQFCNLHDVWLLQDDQSVSQVPQFDNGTRPRTSRQSSVINFVSKEQKRWKSTVQEQRANIYDKHTMLN